MVTVQEIKGKADELFKNKKFNEAEDAYGEAISHVLSTGESSSEILHVLYSNRSGAAAAQETPDAFTRALQDGKKAQELRPDWVKGHNRVVAALMGLKQWKDAEEAVEAGLALDPSNETLLEYKQHIKLKVVRQKSSAALQQKWANGISAKFEHLKSSDPAKWAKVQQTVNILTDENGSPEAMFSLLQDSTCKDVMSELLGIKLNTAGEESLAENGNGNTYSANPTTTSTSSSSQARPQDDSVPQFVREAEACKEEGNRFYKERKFDEAIAKFEEAYKLNGSRPEAITYLNNCGAAYLEAGKIDECLKVCQKALDVKGEVKADPSHVSKTYCRMAAAWKKKDAHADPKARIEIWTQVIDAYQRALLEENNRQVRTFLREAETCKKQAEEEAMLDPEEAERLRDEGNKLYAEKHYAEAKKIYDEAIKRAPSNAKIYANRSACYMMLLEYPMALKDADKAVELQPDYVKAWARKGQLHMRLKEFNKAMQAFRSGLDLEPNNQELQQGMQETVIAIQKMNMAGENDGDRQAAAQRAMEDPEIQNLLADPQFMMILKQLQENPGMINEVMHDPKIADGISKLMASGILKMA